MVYKVIRVHKLGTNSKGEERLRKNSPDLEPKRIAWKRHRPGPNYHLVG